MWFRLRDYDVYLRWVFFQFTFRTLRKGKNKQRPFLRILLSFLSAAFFESIHTDANTSISNVQQVFFFFFASTGITETLGSQVIFISLFPKS